MKQFWNYVKIGFWVLLVVVILIFFFQNVEPTQVRFLFWSIQELPKLALILISMVLGALLTLIILAELRAHRKRKQKE